MLQPTAIGDWVQVVLLFGSLAFPKMYGNLIQMASHLLQTLVLYAISLLFWPFCNSFLISDARADFYLHTWENQYTGPKTSDLRMETTSYFSNSNFDSLGTSYTPSGLQSYARLQGDLTLRHALFERVSLFGRMSWAYVNVLSSTRAGNRLGPMDQSVGFTARLYENPALSFSDAPGSLDLQGQVDFPAYSNTQSNASGTIATGSIHAGDGTVDATGGLFLSIPLWSQDRHLLKTVLGAGYTFRSLGFSAAIPWSFMIQYLQQKRGWRIDLFSSGIYSLRTDPSGILIAVRSSAGTGESLISGASNPSLVQVGGRVGYRTSPSFEFFLGGAQAFLGQSAPSGFTAQGGVSIHLGGLKERDPTHLSPEEYGKSNQGFEQYSLDAKVLKTNDRLNLVKINKGSQDGIEVGQHFDIFTVSQNGLPETTVARAEVMSVKEDESVLNILEYYKEVWINEGFIAKRLIR